MLQKVTRLTNMGYTLVESPPSIVCLSVAGKHDHKIGCDRRIDGGKLLILTLIYSQYLGKNNFVYKSYDSFNVV